MRNLWRIVTALTLTLGITLPAAAQQSMTATPGIPDEFTLRTDPVSLIGAYYNAINRGEFSRAYSYWEQQPGMLSEAQFAAGFADTLSAQVVVRLPVFADAGAGNAYANIPALVIAQHNDGTEHYYAGCFTAHKTNVPVGDATEPDPNWSIQQGGLDEQTTPDLTFLATACQNASSLTSSEFSPGQFDPAALIQSYFAALANGNPQQAAAYWEDASGDVVGQTYGQLISGANDVQVFINPVSYPEGAAGSTYASVPALTLITSAQNESYYITGCSILRRANVPVGDAAEPDPNWHFANATLTEVGSVEAALADLARDCRPQ